MGYEQRVALFHEAWVHMLPNCYDVLGLYKNKLLAKQK